MLGKSIWQKQARKQTSEQDSAGISKQASKQASDTSDVHSLLLASSLLGGTAGWWTPLPKKQAGGRPFPYILLLLGYCTAAHLLVPVTYTFPIESSKELTATQAR
jgi:hypothetical protein